MEVQASLRPLSGSAGDLERLLETWLAADHPPALTVRTSGSSGEPKDVALSAAAVTASARATIERLGGPGQWVLALPAHYVAGMQVLVRSLLSGVSVIALDDVADLPAATRRITHPRRYISLVPTQLHRMMADPTSRAALSTFDAVLLGGSAAAPALVEMAMAAGVSVVTTYGMSETCGGCVYDGTPLEGVDIRIDDGGRVLLAGPVLFDGYVAQPAFTAEVLRDGWLRTPDVGRMDEHGRLHVDGRADQVAVSGGVNVPLAAVERRLLEHPLLTGAAAVGIPDAEWGSRVVAVVTLSSQSRAPSLGELRDFVSAAHPRTWAPREVVVTDALPMLETGKLDRRELLKKVAGRRG